MAQLVCFAIHASRSKIELFRLVELMIVVAALLVCWLRALPQYLLKAAERLQWGADRRGRLAHSKDMMHICCF